MSKKKYPVFIKEVFDRGIRKRGLYLCECGNEFATDVNSVKIGRSKSCGCLKAKNLSKLSKTHGDSLRSSPHKYLYETWCGIKARCYNSKEKAFKNYGGRGILMLPAWRASYQLFKEYVLSELGERPDGYTLDRIDNDGNYEPDNLRWATASEQVRNSRKGILTEEDVKEIKWLLSTGLYSCREIGEDYGVVKSTIQRISSNKNHKEIMI